MRASAKLVLISLADQANDEGLCWPSIKSICSRSGLCENSVHEALGWLEEAKCLERVFRSGRSTHYLLSPSAYIPPPKKTPPQKVPHAEGAPHPPQKSHPTPPKSWDTPPPNGAPITVIEPSVEPSIEPSVPARAKKQPAPTAETWEFYTKAYLTRYLVEPVRNQTTNSQMAAFVKRIGVAESPMVAAFYLTHKASFYVSSGHSVGLLLRDAEKLRTEWATNRAMTATQARHVDQTASNPFARMLDERQRAEAIRGK